MEHNGIRNILFLENVQNFIQKYLIMTLKKPYYTYMFFLYSNHLKHSKVYDVSYKIRNTFTLGSVFVNHDDD